MENIESYFLQPGYIFVSEKPHLVNTVLGSCVSVCLWDSVNKFGGMNHYIYGKARNGERNGRYGDISLQYMLKLLLDMGADKKCLKAHLVGAGQNPHLSARVSEENLEIARRFLERHKITVLTMDTGGFTGRKVVFNTGSGEILVYKGISVRRSDWYPAED